MEWLLMENETGEVYRALLPGAAAGSGKLRGTVLSFLSESASGEFAAGIGKRGGVPCSPSSVSRDVELLLEEESGEVYRALLPGAAPRYISN
jgi:hypothetical protein